jgi:hypothetical protein
VTGPAEAQLLRRVDKGIRHAVAVLWAGGVETFESCEGGKGHAYPEATVRFHGGSQQAIVRLRLLLRLG